MVEQDSAQLDAQIEMLYGALIRLDTETDNEALLEWCKNVCRPELSVVDGLVANFVASYQEKEYASKLLKVLR